MTHSQPTQRGIVTARSDFPIDLWENAGRQVRCPHSKTGGSEAARVASHHVISVHPTSTDVAPGQVVRFEFMTLGDERVRYRVQCADESTESWCRLLLPAALVGPGELVVDVPAGARPGRYDMRLVAVAGRRTIAAADITLRISGERCLKVVARPKITLQGDGTVVVSLRVLNCGIVDTNLVLRAHHEDRWTFDVDEPELIIGVGKGPLTVKVTLRPPAGKGVGKGDEVTVDVDTGTGWRRHHGHVQQPHGHWTVAAAIAAAAVAIAAGAAVAWPGESDSVPTTAVPTNGPGPTDTESTDSTNTTQAQTDPVVIDSLDVDYTSCASAAEWTASGDPDGHLELSLNGEAIDEEFSVGPGSYETPFMRSESAIYELVAYDSDDVETDRMSDSDQGTCVE